MSATLYALLAWRCSLSSTAILMEKRVATISIEGAVLEMNSQQTRHSDESVLSRPAAPSLLAPTLGDTFEPTLAASNFFAATMDASALMSSLALENMDATLETMSKHNRSDLESLYKTWYDSVLDTACKEDVWVYYKRIEEVGAGAYGKVYSATGKGGEKLPVAVKAITNPRSFNPMEIQPARYGLPNNADLLEVYKTAGQNLFLVYPLYGAGDLQGYLEEIGRGLWVQDVHTIAKQIAFGLWVLHGKGYVHRDLKPANIMLRERRTFVRLGRWDLKDEDEDTLDGCVIIGDYGTVVSGCTKDNAKCARGKVGSGYWMSQNQWLGDDTQSGPEYGPEADWHAFGVILYQLTLGPGSHPFRFAGESDAKLVQRIKDRGEPNLDGIRNEALKKLLTLLLTKELDDIEPGLWWEGGLHPVLADWYWVSTGTGTQFGRPWNTSIQRFWKAVCRESQGLVGKPDGYDPFEGEDNACNFDAFEFSKPPSLCIPRNKKL